MNIRTCIYKNVTGLAIIFLVISWMVSFLLVHHSLLTKHKIFNLITVQQDATVFSLLHFCRQLYMFQVLTPIIRSWYSCNYSFWYWLTGSTTIHFHCWVGIDSWISSILTTTADGSRPSWPVPEAVITAEPAPEDGCQHLKHVELPTEM